MFLGQGITPFKNNGGALGTPFTVSYSFLLDGVDEYFTVPNADLSSTLLGTTKKFTIGGSILKNGTLGESFFSCWGTSFILQFDGANKLNLLVRDGTNYNLTSSFAFTSTVDWVHFMVTFDYSLTVGNRGGIFHNGATLTVTDDLTDTINSSATDFTLGVRTAPSSVPFEGYINQFFVLDRAATLAEHIAWYNLGEPLNPQSYFGGNCKWFFNPDNSGSTAQFPVLDSVNSITATSVNMEDADKTTTTPY